MTFTDFVCLFLVVRGRAVARRAGSGPAGGGGRRGPAAAKPAGERRQDSGDPRTNTKTLWAGANAPAHSRLVKTPVLT